MAVAEGIKDKRRRKRPRAPRQPRPISSTQTSSRVPTRTPSAFQYTSHPNSGRYYVYMLHNPGLDATKIGVGSYGRVEQHLSSVTSTDADGINVGWKVLRLGQFESRSDFADIERANAYAAEARVLRYWRKGLGLSHPLERKQMGYSRMSVNGREGWVSTRGWSETVSASAICEVSTWSLVEQSTGFQENAEQDKYLRDLIRRESVSLDQEGFNRYLDPDSFRPKQEYGQAFNRIRPVEDGETSEQRFWKHVERGDDDECWNWLGTKSHKGYSIYLWDGKIVQSHRVIRHFMGIEEYQVKLTYNRCGRRDCINPQHWGPLQRGTFKCVTPGCENICPTTTKSSLCYNCQTRRRRGQLN